MHTVEEALAEVARAAGPPRRVVERVALEDAPGRVLACDVPMDHDVPPFDRASMDGYAVAQEVAPGTTLEVRGLVAAGSVPAEALGPGGAVRIMTGAPVPAGTRRVVPFEWTREEHGRVRVERVPDAASHVVAAGAYARAGAVVLAAGRRLDAGAVGALAAAGREEVEVAAPPRVGVLGTGTELVPVARTPGPGQIRNSNTALLKALVRRAGAAPVDLGIAPDDEQALRAAIRRGLEAELLLLSGGVSRGDLDLVPAALEAEGVETVFHRWRVQPGGPLLFGRRGTTLVFGLPGNPAATFVGFEVLVVPAIASRLGLPVVARSTLRARYVGPWGPAAARRRYRPVALGSDGSGGLVAEALPWAGSGDPLAAARARALAALPEGVAEGAGGGLVDVLCLEPPP